MVVLKKETGKIAALFQHDKTHTELYRSDIKCTTNFFEVNHFLETWKCLLMYLTKQLSNLVGTLLVALISPCLV